MLTGFTNIYDIHFELRLFGSLQINTGTTSLKQQKNIFDKVIKILIKASINSYSCGIDINKLQ